MKKTPAALILMAFGMLALSGHVLAQDHGGDAQFLDLDAEFLGLLDLTRAGQSAPDIQFLDGQGQRMTLRDFTGTALVVNFWATWCAPCIAEMPALDRLNQGLLPTGGQVIAINTDFDPDAAQAWLQDNQIMGLEAFFDDTGNAFFDAGGGGLPYSLIIDAQGMIVAEIFGDAPWDTPAALAYVRELGISVLLDDEI